MIFLKSAAKMNINIHFDLKYKEQITFDAIAPIPACTDTSS